MSIEDFSVSRRMGSWMIFGSLLTQFSSTISELAVVYML
jgi:hypothetical protein